MQPSHDSCHVLAIDRQLRQRDTTEKHQLGVAEESKFALPEPNGLSYCLALIYKRRFLFPLATLRQEAARSFAGGGPAGRLSGRRQAASRAKTAAALRQQCCNDKMEENSQKKVYDGTKRGFCALSIFSRQAAVESYVQWNLESNLPSHDRFSRRNSTESCVENNKALLVKEPLSCPHSGRRLT